MTGTVAAIQEVVGEALGDPSVAIGVWDPDRGGYLNASGAPLELPPDSPAVTFVTRNARPVAALVHDPMLDTGSDAVRGVAAMIPILIDNARLVEDLQGSRWRIVQSAVRERRRLQHDLHDGAQARLVAMQMRLQIARDLAGGQELAMELAAAQVDAEAAVDELRALARRIYPTVLHDLGPATALRDLASTSSLPLQVVDHGIGRSSDAVEAAIYFCADQAIHNMLGRTGSAEKVTVTLGRRHGVVEFTVAYDGAEISTGTDPDAIVIPEMRDALEAVGGKLEIVYASVHRTAVRGTIPQALA